MKQELVSDFINRRIFNTTTPVSVTTFFEELEKWDAKVTTNSFYEIDVMERIMVELEEKHNKQEEHYVKINGVTSLMTPAEEMKYINDLEKEEYKIRKQKDYITRK